MLESQAVWREKLNMKAVLFYPRIEDSFRASYPPLGIMSIATYLNANGHEAIICDRFFETDSVRDVLKKHRPDVIGVSVISFAFIKDASDISKKAKSMGIPVIWGGIMPSTIPQETLSSNYVDYVSFNEGEYTWLEMANAFDEGKPFDNIDGLGFIRDGVYIRTPDRGFIDLSTLPKIDWTLVKPENYFQTSYGYEKMLSTYLSKGCFGSCTYCYNPEFHCSTRRQRPIEHVIDEMRYLIENHGAGGFDFTDDLMFLNRSQVMDFCKTMVDSGLDTRWSGYLRIGIINDATDYKTMYDSGCRCMIYGVESGSERILRSVNKKTPLDKIVSNITNCLEAGIVPIVMFMIGFPGETAEDLKATVSLAKQLKGAVIAFGCFTPLPGSAIQRELVENGKLIPPKTLEEYSEVTFADDVTVNVTQVSTLELMTIRNFFRLRGIFTKSGDSSDEQFLKVLANTLRSMSSRGIGHFLRSGFYTAFSLMKTFTIIFHPKIRKKYGLYFRK